jgi:hypothetical protein
MNEQTSEAGLCLPREIRMSPPFGRDQGTELTVTDMNKPLTSPRELEDEGFQGNKTRLVDTSMGL